MRGKNVTTGDFPERDLMDDSGDEGQGAGAGEPAHDEVAEEEEDEL